MSDKPFKGRIKVLSKIPITDEGPAGLGYLYLCVFLDHSQFAGKMGHTSMVFKDDGFNVETRNSRYEIVT